MNTSRLLSRLRMACIPAMVALAPAQGAAQSPDDGASSEEASEQSGAGGTEEAESLVDPPRLDPDVPPRLESPDAQPARPPEIPDVDADTLELIDSTPVQVANNGSGYVLVTKDVAILAQTGLHLDENICPETIAAQPLNPRTGGRVDTYLYRERSEQISAERGEEVCLYFWSIFRPFPTRGRVLQDDAGAQVVASLVPSRQWL